LAVFSYLVSSGITVKTSGSAQACALLTSSSVVDQSSVVTIIRSLEIIL